MPVGKLPAGCFISDSTDFMISFRNLFKFSQKEISFAFDHIVDKRYYRGLKLLKTIPPTPATHGKLLIITPRAVGKATERNLIRRRIKDIYFKEKCYQAPYVWIIIVSSKAQTISFESLKKFLLATMHPLRPPLQP